MSEALSGLGPLPVACPAADLAELGDRAAGADALDGRVAVGADETVGCFVRLYRELFPPVHGYVRFRVGDRQAAEDLVALVFERALARLATVREPERVRAWLFTIARNAVADYRRSHRPASDLEAAERLEHLWIDSPEADAVRHDERRRLAAYLAELTDRERELIGLKFAAGLPNREVGRVLGLSETNVAQIAHRAVVKLRRRFDAEETTR